MIEYLSGIIAFVTSFIGLIPQIYKALKTKSASDISMAMLINYMICSAAWIVYGSASESIFVLLSNIVGLISCIILIFQKRYYDSYKIS
jgi:MtN3 and saliva related transmembrane protein